MAPSRLGRGAQSAASDPVTSRLSQEMFGSGGGGGCARGVRWGTVRYNPKLRCPGRPLPNETDGRISDNNLIARPIVCSQSGVPILIRSS
ncbi:hypothetical protein JZ751_019406 [Albula glossodonta]|uniref:Uncharacterized protein n=1 Tax=Albula glossodonta TaxID=121402 RepID=A0A8T2NMQ0_9TELE|nr:hypothetical protein JZ751_019406 [Albula glossodonta]